MALFRPELRHGRIIWAHLRNARGKREEHPAVILSTDDNIVQPEDFDPRRGGDNVILVAGISTKYRNNPNPYVQLPYRDSASGHAVTHLKKDCAAVVGWYQAIYLPDDILDLAGDVPTALMRQMNSKVHTDYIAAVGNQYVTSLEMLAQLKKHLTRKDPPR